MSEGFKGNTKEEQLLEATDAIIDTLVEKKGEFRCLVVFGMTDEKAEEVDNGHHGIGACVGSQEDIVNCLLNLPKDILSELVRAIYVCTDAGNDESLGIEGLRSSPKPTGVLQ